VSKKKVSIKSDLAQWKINIFERNKTKKIRAVSAVLLVLEPFNNFDFQRSYMAFFLETGVAFFGGHQI